jgi:FkbM family methyltransferase
MTKDKSLNNYIDLIDQENLNTYLYKKKSKEDFSNYNLKKLHSLPTYNGVVNLKFFHNNIKFKMLNIQNDDAVVLKYFWKNYFEPTTLKLWNEINKKNGIYFDVGSHTGIYTLCSQLYNPKNLSISIEPSYMNFTRLLNNLRLNHLPFNNCFNVAASNKEGIIKFDNRTKINYLSQSGKIDPYGKDQIKAIILDNFIFENKSLPINCIKIDTEGHEAEVLEGSKKIIQKYFPDFFIELNERSADKCFSFLKEFGYCYFLINEKNNEVHEIKLINKEMLKDEGVNYLATKKNISEINSLLN